ncbi:hypothetical protein VT52_005935 [Streptomyces malaysiense]|uniref:Uncharacterized protein n=2 Tax=Streptomyces malaysiense TaxID=1428626 RepID=A0A1J4Q5B9_9ACTN|nr:hypothetical protein VT52_005935 [Streptomyces malaysiense]
MDYCSGCRRHLNGALVCPGCGACAPDVAPGAGGSPARAAMTEVPRPGRESGTAPDSFPDEPDPVAHTSADVADAPSAGEGRAARRRQRARWKKNQRRAVVATAVALVGGGLTVASMDRHTADRAQASAPPDDRSMSGAPQDEAPGQAPDPAATPGTPPAHRPARTAGTPGGTGTVRQTLATHHRAAAPDPRPDSAAPVTPVPQARPATARQPRSTTAAAPATGGTGSPVSAAPATPAPASTTGGTGRSTAAAPPPARASTSPEQLCVLVLCIG